MFSIWLSKFLLKGSLFPVHPVPWFPHLITNAVQVPELTASGDIFQIRHVIKPVAMFTGPKAGRNIAWSDRQSTMMGHVKPRERGEPSQPRWCRRWVGRQSKTIRLFEFQTTQRPEDQQGRIAVPQRTMSSHAHLIYKNWSIESWFHCKNVTTLQARIPHVNCHS